MGRRPSRQLRECGEFRRTRSQGEAAEPPVLAAYASPAMSDRTAALVSEPIEQRPPTPRRFFRESVEALAEPKRGCLDAMTALRSTLRLFLLSLTQAFVDATLPGQTCAYFPDANAATGTVSTAPFGDVNPLDPATANQAILFRVPRSALPTQPARILALGFAAAGDRVHQFATLQVRLGHAAPGGLVPIFSQNMPGFTANVFSQASWTWRTPADQWQFIGLSSDFPFDPALGDLAVMITVGGGASTGTGMTGFRSDPTIPHVLQTAWRFAPGVGVVGMGAPKVKICWNARDLQTFGSGCVGSHGRIPQLGLTGTAAPGGVVSIALADAAPTSPGALLVLDPRIRADRLDLAPFGAPGCTLDTFFLTMIYVPVQGGSVTIPAPVPNQPSIVGLRLWAQWAVIDLAANNLGVVTSPVGRILVGN